MQILRALQFSLLIVEYKREMSMIFNAKFLCILDSIIGNLSNEILYTHIKLLQLLRYTNVSKIRANLRFKDV